MPKSINYQSPSPGRKEPVWAEQSLNVSLLGRQEGRSKGLSVLRRLILPVGLSLFQMWPSNGTLCQLKQARTEEAGKASVSILWDRCSLGPFLCPLLFHCLVFLPRERLPLALPGNSRHSHPADGLHTGRHLVPGDFKIIQEERDNEGKNPTPGS